MAIPATPLSGRQLEIFNEVHARNGIWEAYDQGRMAHAQGRPRTSNDFSHPFLSGHSYEWDWYKGWDNEQQQQPDRRGPVSA